ncbi:nitroreductase/quinone reductase family protein [Streptomyces sp. NPDC101234]|uniref:nitroreductase/quinone reductase family protein n=1 Tax=Streptomyces sp. NPDC101234 TaxID=3366138 RepID=UPI0037F61D68
MNRWVNRPMTAMMRSPRWSRFLERRFVVITYVGRRSGRTFSTPVNYRRDGDQIVIDVVYPDEKKWWRNFQDPGGPISLRLKGSERTGHAVVLRDDRGEVRVVVELDQAVG